MNIFEEEYIFLTVYQPHEIALKTCYVFVASVGVVTLFL